MTYTDFMYLSLNKKYFKYFKIMKNLEKMKKKTRYSYVYFFFVFHIKLYCELIIFKYLNTFLYKK